VLSRLAKLSKAIGFHHFPLMFHVLPLEGVACVDDVTLAAVLLATSKSRRWQSALALWGEAMPLGDGSGMGSCFSKQPKKMHIIAYIYI
jgi:hypothetical protein